MSFKKFLKYLMPPFLKDILHKIQNPYRNHVDGKFKDYEEAMSLLQYDFTWTSEKYLSQLSSKYLTYKKKLSGNNIPSLFYLSSISILMGLYSSNKSVLDFGGGVGLHYLTASKIFKDLDWTILETPSFIKKFSNFGDKNIKYVDKMPDKNFDILFMSTNLQFLEDPLSFLKKNSKKFSQVIISEVILTEEKTYISIQTKLCLNNIKKSYAHPIWIFNLNDLINALKPLKLQANLFHPGGIEMSNKIVKARSLCFKK